MTTRKMIVIPTAGLLMDNLTAMWQLYTFSASPSTFGCNLTRDRVIRRYAPSRSADAEHALAHLVGHGAASMASMGSLAGDEDGARGLLGHHEFPAEPGAGILRAAVAWMLRILANRQILWLWGHSLHHASLDICLPKHEIPQPHKRTQMIMSITGNKPNWRLCF